MPKVIRVQGDTSKIVGAPTFTASEASLCPVCGRYIAKNVSKIAKLPEPIMPNVVIYEGSIDVEPAHATFEISGRTFRWIKIWRARAYVHADCYELGLSLIDEQNSRSLSRPKVVKHPSDRA